MALPENGSVWPPQSHDNAFKDYRENDAWYTGNIDDLEAIYAYPWASGIYGQKKRTFWGSPTPTQQSQRPIKLHVPVAAEIARMSAQVIFGELPIVEFKDLDEDGDTPAGTQKQLDTMNQRLAELLDDGAHAAFLESAELGAALGGSFLRVTWDTSLDDKPFLTMVSPDNAVPLFQHGRLISVTFWADLPKIPNDRGQYRLMECHEPGTIEWGLYRSETDDNTGQRIPLTEHPNTAGLAPAVNAQSMIETGSDLLTAAYFPNIRPNRSRRKDPVAVNLGRSDYDGAADLFDALDETYTSWMRDIRLGKARVLIDRSLLDVNGPGEGAQFNTDREVFTPMKPTLSSGAGNAANSAPITQLDFKIRYQEHHDTATHLLTRVFAVCGYSPQTFGEAGPNPVRSITATEVDSREKLTMMTRSTKILYVKPQIRRIAAALMDVDQFVYNGPGRNGDMPEVEFPDAVAPSLDALATSLQLLRAAEAASTETLVEMLHPDWDADKVSGEVERINAAKQSALPDPMFMHPSDGGVTDGPAGTGDSPTAGDATGNG